MDDIFMSKCFENALECIELMLRIILGKKDLKVVRSQTEYPIKSLQGRGVRFDARNRARHPDANGDKTMNDNVYQFSVKARTGEDAPLKQYEGKVLLIADTDPPRTGEVAWLFNSSTLQLFNF